MAAEYLLQEYYIRYLRDIRKVSDTSIRQYQNALSNISRFLKRENKIHQTIYEVLDIEELEELRNFLYQNKEFMEQNQRGHRMYSAGLNNYLDFANGEEFVKSKINLSALDTAMPIAQKNILNQTVWKRSSIIRKQAVKEANYLCTIDANHKTFISENTHQQYMEVHHIISMYLQNKFSCSLDVYANVICLCPICHRLLHYGIKEQKIILLNQIYDDRADRFVKSGIRISKNEFLEMLQ